MKSLILALAAASSVVAGPVTYNFVRRSTGIVGGLFSAHTGTVNSVNMADNSTGGISNINDLLYAMDLSVCGQNITVQLDTGSTDLWVAPPKPLQGARVYDLSVKLTYGIGSVTGDVTLCPVGFAHYLVPEQALLTATSADFDNLFSKKVYGIMGLGFDSLSGINQAVMKADKGAPWGRSLLSNMFLQSPATPNFIAFNLERAGDLDEESNGSFTIGENHAGFEAIMSQPQLPTFPDTVTRWTVPLDSVSVNGKAITYTSIVKGAPTGKYIALLDTGASLALGPKVAIDAIYSSIQGSYYYAAEDIWVVPCLGETLVEFTFAGIKYAIHPLDLTIVTTVTFTDGKTGTVCIAAFRTNNLKAGAGEFDWLLGDSYLRNVYSLFDFGDTDAYGNLISKAYVKLLSTTVYSNASAEFKTARAQALAALPPLADPTTLAAVGGGSSDTPSTPKSLASDSTGSDTSTILTTLDKMQSYIPYILGLLGANVLIMFILLIVGCAFYFKRRGRTYSPITY